MGENRKIVTVLLGRIKDLRCAAMLAGACALVCFTSISPAIAAPDSEIGVAKAVTAGPTLVADGTISLQYTIYVSNPTDFDVEDVQVTDDFTSIFTSPASIISATVSSSDFSVDHTGIADTTLLDGTDTLAAGASGVITVDVVVDPEAETGPFLNQADLEAETVCQVGEGTISGLAQERWDLPGSNIPSSTVDLSVNFNDGLDGQGFHSETSTPTNTGNTTADGAQLFTTGSATSGREIMQGGGWVAAPCANPGDTWEMRFEMGVQVATYLGALAVNAAPTSADIITGGGGVEGFQQNITLFRAGTVSTSSIFTGTLGLPVGVKMQIDDRGSANRFVLYERINGGAWIEVPAGRIYADQPTGAEVGGRTISDESDNGSNADPSSDNGAGTQDDPTPVTLPLHNPSLFMEKSADDDTDRAVGDDIEYTYEVTNDGTVTITNISITDTHNAAGSPPTPDDEAILTDVAPLGDSDTGVANDGIWATLGVGDTITFTGNYIVQQEDVDTLQ